VTAEHDGAEVVLTAKFLYSCSGYYRYDAGFRPEFPGLADFRGTVVHPQEWPADLDCTGKRVVVIGSGATAVTLVPALADTAERVTMVQRSPSYILPSPGRDPLAARLRRLLGARRAAAVVRWKNVAVQILLYQLSRRRPEYVKKLIRTATVNALPAGYDVDTHFRPRYQPWDQRLCIVPDGDLFAAIRSGQADVVTDTIDTFTGTGLRLSSGAELPADLVITATGLRLLPIGGIALVVDGKPVELPDTVAYKGLMLSGVPNFAFTIGYTNASWTLRADLVGEYVVRLLKFLDQRGYQRCVPVRGAGVAERPLMDFDAGYVLRSIGQFPRAGSRQPWRLGTNYARDVLTLRHSRIDDGVLRFA
jgi:cation diffusion facilitator CzcD-associated flavoprotein CzcO